MQYRRWIEMVVMVAVLALPGSLLAGEDAGHGMHGKSMGLAQSLKGKDTDAVYDKADTDSDGVMSMP